MKAITTFQMCMVSIFVVDGIGKYFLGWGSMGLDSICILGFAITWCVHEDRKDT